MFFRNLLVVFGIFFIVGGVAMMANVMQQETPVTQQTAQSSAVEAPVATEHEILITAHPLNAGTLLRETDIAWKPAKPEEVRPGAILRGQPGSENILGAIARRDFAQNEPMLAGDLVLSNDRRFLAAVLRPGNRAVSISVDAPQSASGLVLPGDFVDVILTQNLGEGVTDLSKRSVAETVLRNVRVIAVDRQLSKPSVTETAIEATTGLSNVPKTVTLEVDEREAEKLFVATQLGALQLSVRPLATLRGEDEDIPRASPTWASDVSPALREFAGKPVLAAPAAPVTGIEALIRRPPAAYQ
ncbi:MAG: Flp pilus assembly protein CpaB [Hyphomicrobiales bacterium]|nr:Flp pilus assembly protein CpaB [Hyphomicrobiales bacterium]